MFCKTNNFGLKKDILEEILENNPELKKDKKKLEKIILFLEKNNPEIIISKDFKNNLKSRLNNIIKFNEINKKRKVNFFWFLNYFVPVFSLFFIVSTWFYLYKDMFFIEQKDLQFNNEKILDIFLEEESLILEDNFKKNIDIINNEILLLKRKKEEWFSQKKEIIKKEVIFNKTNSNNEEKGNNIIVKDNKIEVVDNQIIEILWDDNLVEQNTRTLDWSFNNSEQTYPESDFINVGKPVNIEDESVMEDYKILEFEEFCEKELWKIIIKNWNKYCIIKEEICLENDYKNNSCIFTQKK